MATSCWMVLEWYRIKMTEIIQIQSGLSTWENTSDTGCEQEQGYKSIVIYHVNKLFISIKGWSHILWCYFDAAVVFFYIINHYFVYNESLKVLKHLRLHPMKSYIHEASLTITLKSENLLIIGRLTFLTCYQEGSSQRGPISKTAPQSGLWHTSSWG